MTKTVNPILILGIGNSLQGDDGVGCHVIHALEAQARFKDVDLIDGGTMGLGIVNFFEGRHSVIIIDAAQMNDPPGTVRHFKLDGLADPSAKPYSLHHIGVAEAIQLARAIHLPMPEINLIGIQPMWIDWGETCSAPVQAAIPRVVSQVMQIVDSVRSTQLSAQDHQEQTNYGE